MGIFSILKAHTSTTKIGSHNHSDATDNNKVSFCALKARDKISKSVETLQEVRAIEHYRNGKLLDKVSEILKRS